MSALEPGTIAWAIAGDGCGPSDIGGIPHLSTVHQDARSPELPANRVPRAKPLVRMVRAQASNPQMFARYGRLVVTSIQVVDGARLCQPRCDCGRVMRWTLLSLVASGAVQSCGCGAKRVAS